ncbi:MAG: DUF1566 domain-containing protein [Nitrospirae bacterium]|nr:DUF1566 domain-containing protein [Nitrospirota bacterium]
MSLFSIKSRTSSYVMKIYAKFQQNADKQSALNAANSLANGQCGLTDGSVAGNWHLPNRKELLSLADFSQYNPALPVNNPFTNVKFCYPFNGNYCSYWMSTSVVSHA